MNIKRALTILLMCTAFLGAIACGMSEGQSATLYLGSVTVHERRLEDDSVKLAKMSESGAAKEDIVKEMERISKSISSSKSEIEALQVPQSCEDIHKIYLEAFDISKKRVDAAAKIYSPKADTADFKALEEEFNKEGEQLNEIAEKIREAKIKISKKYPEVQVPEAYDPQDLPQETSDKLH